MQVTDTVVKGPPADTVEGGPPPRPATGDPAAAAAEGSAAETITAAELQVHLWTLWSGSSISRIGHVSATTAGPLLALHLTSSPVFAGLVTAAGTVPNLLLHLPAGVIVDRFNRGLIMVVSQFARLAAAGLLVWGLLVLDDPAPLLPLTIAIESVFAATFHMSEMAALPRMVPRAEFSKTMTKNEARNHATLLLSRPLSGLLCGLTLWAPFAASMLTALASLALLTRVKHKHFKPHPAEQDDKPKMAKQVGESLTWLWNDAFLRKMFFVCMVTNTLFQMVIILLIVLAKREGLPSVFIGVLLAASGLGGLLGSFLAKHILKRGIQRWHSLRHVAFTATLSWLALTFVILVSHQPASLLLVWAGVGFVGAYVNVALTTYQVTSVPEAQRGRVASLHSLATRGPAALGALCGGLIISMLGVRWAAAAVVVVMIVLTILVAPYRREMNGDNRHRMDMASMAFREAEL